MRGINGTEIAGILWSIELLRNKKSRPYIIADIILMPLIAIGCAFVSEYAHSINQYELIFGLYLLLSIILVLVLVGKALTVYIRDVNGLSTKSSNTKFWVLPLKNTLILFFCLFLPSFGIIWLCLFMNYLDNKITKESLIFLSILFLVFGIILFIVANGAYKAKSEKLQKENLTEISQKEIKNKS